MPLPEFPYPLVEVFGAKAQEAWKWHQELWRKEGSSAVILGDADDVCDIAQGFEWNETPERILDAAKSITPESFRSHPIEEYENDYAEWADEWPAEEIAPVEFQIHIEPLIHQPKKKVLLARIPTAKSFEIPAYLCWGNWNKCPTPAEHVALLRDWNERFGLEIYGMTHDQIECVIERPPTDKLSSVKLALEQLLYCIDIAEQGPVPLAAKLLNSRCWYFRWD